MSLQIQYAYVLCECVCVCRLPSACTTVCVCVGMCMCVRVYVLQIHVCPVRMRTGSEFLMTWGHSLARALSLCHSLFEHPLSHAFSLATPLSLVLTCVHSVALSFLSFFDHIWWSIVVCGRILFFN